MPLKDEQVPEFHGKMPNVTSETLLKIENTSNVTSETVKKSLRTATCYLLLVHQKQLNTSTKSSWLLCYCYL